MNDPKTIVEPLAGYLLDVRDKLMNRVFVPHSMTKLHNLQLVRKLSGATSVIEVGSYKGVTARRLSRIFDVVHTIEIDRDLHEQAKARCRDRKNIQLYLGDGAKLLGEVLEKVDKAVLFLDGHFSGGATGHGDEPEPVLAEIDLIIPHLHRLVGVVVDDFRLFGVEPRWPRKSDVLAKLETVFPHPAWGHSILNDQFLVYRLA